MTRPPYDDLWPAEFAPAEPLSLLDRQFAAQFCLEQARAFVYGQQPTLANFKPALLETRPEEMAYGLGLARLRQRAQPWLLHGQMLPAPGLNAPRAEIHFSRLSIYAGHGEPLQEFRKTVPLALATAWGAPDGRVGVAVASIAEQPLPLRLDLGPLQSHLTGRRQLFRLNDSGRTPLGEWTHATRSLEISLPRRGACILEFTPASSGP